LLVLQCKEQGTTSQYVINKIMFKETSVER
jgi:hypothetical protein